MLKLIKKFFAKEEKEEIKVNFSDLDKFLKEKEKELDNKIRESINELLFSIKKEASGSKSNLDKLEQAELQNPNIPPRAKTIMQGNRDAFTKKTSDFFSNLNLEYEHIDEIRKKCDGIKKNIDNLASSTQRSYTILNEFFAREISPISENIRKVSNYIKDLQNLIDHSSLSGTKKIKSSYEEMQRKIKQKSNFVQEEKEKTKELIKGKEKLGKLNKELTGKKESAEYSSYEKVMEEKEKKIEELRDVENSLINDLSPLGKAMKKYSRIAFGNEKIIENYLNSPMNALLKDELMEIVKILGNIEHSIKENKLDMDQKKNEKALSKIKDLDSIYFNSIREKYKKNEKNLEEIKEKLNNNKIKEEIDSLNEEISKANSDVHKKEESLNTVKNEINKINPDEMKIKIQEMFDKNFDEKIIIS
ncbi:hypothetical protein ISS07_02425 [Candidatus Woesearchaeota archaeon]|nr:hypothetical protein [Candidatus Woesearchaeota archaeon]